jgi:hypothetical protein
MTYSKTTVPSAMSGVADVSGRDGDAFAADEVVGRDPAVLSAAHFVHEHFAVHGETVALPIRLDHELVADE